jgi:hypothetical protein
MTQFDIRFQIVVRYVRRFKQMTRISRLRGNFMERCNITQCRQVDHKTFFCDSFCRVEREKAESSSRKFLKPTLPSPGDRRCSGNRRFDFEFLESVVPSVRTFWIFNSNDGTMLIVQCWKGSIHLVLRFYAKTNFLILGLISTFRKTCEIKICIHDDLWDIMWTDVKTFHHAIVSHDYSKFSKWQ